MRRPDPFSRISLQRKSPVSGATVPRRISGLSFNDMFYGDGNTTEDAPEGRIPEPPAHDGKAQLPERSLRLWSITGHSDSIL